jgi:hypothetical protein
MTPSVNYFPNVVASIRNAVDVYTMETETITNFAMSVATYTETIAIKSMIYA